LIGHTIGVFDSIREVEKGRPASTAISRPPLATRRRSIKLGIISDLRNPEDPRFHRLWIQHYNEFLDLIVHLEEIGFEEVVFPEHHCEADGYIPNPIPMMTAVAMKTKEMLVGADLFRLPDWHPVLLAEDVAMVDIISDERVLFKAGAGGPFPPISSGLGWYERARLSRSAETMQIIK
jgi:alkanesulfonate monooxygenase SsuD/methylene tetrahydromethanopterin reductase-like flavin-dependent oxidoreductase (luciferase family)